MVIPLRHTVLRVGRPLLSAHFEGDELPTTEHFALFREGAASPLAVLSLFSTSPPEGLGPFRQLRGMAVAASHQRKGLGTELLKHALRACPQEHIWCNARAHAVPFYLRNGFAVEGEPFVIPLVGQHFQMRLMR